MAARVHKAAVVLEHRQQRHAENTDLTAVRVPREREHRTVRRTIVDELRMMREQHRHRPLRHPRERLRGERPALRRKRLAARERIVHTRKEERLLPRRHGRRLVDEQVDLRLLQRRTDGGKIAHMLMVAIDVPDSLREPRDILRCERDGTRVERVVIEDVARQDERVRRARRRALEQLPIVLEREEPAEMDIAELGDAEPPQRGGKLSNGQDMLPYHGRRLFIEAAVEPAREREHGIRRRMSQQPTPSPVHAHGAAQPHEPLPEHAERHEEDEQRLRYKDDHRRLQQHARTDRKIAKHIRPKHDTEARQQKHGKREPLQPTRPPLGKHLPQSQPMQQEHDHHQAAKHPNKGNRLHSFPPGDAFCPRTRRRPICGRGARSRASASARARARSRRATSPILPMFTRMPIESSVKMSELPP